MVDYCYCSNGHSTTPTVRSRSRSRSPISRSPEIPYQGQSFIHDAHLKTALDNISQCLNAIVTRVERVEDELKQQRKSLSNTPSSSCDITPRRPKVNVPLVVRVSNDRLCARCLCVCVMGISFP